MLSRILTIGALLKGDALLSRGFGASLRMAIYAINKLCVTCATAFHPGRDGMYALPVAP